MLTTTVGEVDQAEREAIAADRLVYNVQHKRRAVDPGPDVIEGEIAAPDRAPGFLERHHSARHAWMGDSLAAAGDDAKAATAGGGEVVLDARPLLTAYDEVVDVCDAGGFSIASA